MAKGKNKINHAKADEIRRREQRNKFFDKLERLCFDITNDPKIYKLIPKGDFDFLITIFGKGIRVKAGEGQVVPPEMIQDTKQLIPELFRMQKLPIIPGGRMMDLYDFLTVGYALLLYDGRLKEGSREDFPGAKSIIKALEPYSNFTERYEEAFGHFINLLYTISFMNSDMTTRVYLVKYESMSLSREKTPTGFTIDIYCQPAEKIHVTIDGTVRPAFRSGWLLPVVDKFIEWTSIKAETFPFKHKYGNKSFDVYVQSHAFERLSERIDCTQLGILHLQLFLSLKTPKIIKGMNGSLLIEMRASEKKVGYLVGEIIEDKIIIKTFLFLTHYGTPEGDKLRNSTGLLKEDQIYLEMDKLSTFILTDLKDDQRLRKIFTDVVVFLRQHILQLLILQTRKRNQ